MSTICAISTPLGVGGISVIRMSGDAALSVADKVFSGRKKPSEMAGYTCAFGRITDGGAPIDDVLLTVFKAPHSYTGEDTVEISCHGGIYVTRRVLSLLLKSGAKQASAGEFTKRAFLNGKLDLTQAEGVMDIISSEGERALNSANNMRDGRVFKKISAVRERLVESLSGLAAWADYPEEDISPVDFKKLTSELRQAVSELSALIKSCDDGIVFKEGIKTAIVGCPNAGKSSVMNLLLGFDRSIVASVAGTTRDTVEETARLGDITLRLTDTAGLRETDDAVEAEGVLRARKKLSDARLVLAVFDISRALSPDDLSLISSLDSGKTIMLLNKLDIAKNYDLSPFDGFKTVLLSAKTGEGADELRQKILSAVGADTSAFDGEVFASERQKACAASAKELLDGAIGSLESGETPDAATVLMQRALEKLCELTGESASEAVVTEVFSRFCVGK